MTEMATSLVSWRQETKCSGQLDIAVMLALNTALRPCSLLATSSTTTLWTSAPTFPSPMSSMVRSLKRILLFFIHVGALVYLLLLITLEFEGKDRRCSLIFGVDFGVEFGVEFGLEIRDVGCAVCQWAGTLNSVDAGHGQALYPGLSSTVWSC